MLYEVITVIGRFPEIELELKNPVGSKTGELFPTGNKIDVIDGVEVTCIDVSVPMVIIPAKCFDKTGYESVQDYDTNFVSKLKKIWIKAGLLMKLKNNNGQLMTIEELEGSSYNFV